MGCKASSHVSAPTFGSSSITSKYLPYGPSPSFCPTTEAAPLFYRRKLKNVDLGDEESLNDVDDII